MTAPHNNHIWMDLTATLRAESATFNGTTRTERRLAEELLPLLDGRLRFCAYSSGKQAFESVSLPVVSVGGEQPRSPARSAISLSFGRELERRARLGIRGAIRHLWRRQRSKQPESAFPRSQSGDVIFLAGETWSRRYDLDVIGNLRNHGRRIAVLCQDLIPISHPQFFDSPDFVAGFRKYFSFVAKEADLIVAISESTKAEIIRFAQPLGGLVGRIEVVELGSDFDARPPKEPALPFKTQPHGFVIAVSTIQSRKNFELLYKLWRRFAEEGLDHIPALLIVGRRGFGTQDLMWQIENDPLVADRLAVLHSVSDSELSWLYQNCLFSLYPSLVEGWGLPVSESLAFGKMCIASNAYSIPEAGAGLAMHLDPHDFLGWYRQIRELVETPDRLSQLNAEISRRYARTSWGHSAAKISVLLRSQLSAS